MAKFHTLLATLTMGVALNATADMDSVFQELRAKGGEHTHREISNSQRSVETFSYATSRHSTKSSVNVKWNPDILFQIGGVIFDTDPTSEDQTNLFDNMETLFFGD